MKPIHSSKKFFWVTVHRRKREACDEQFLYASMVLLSQDEVLWGHLDVEFEKSCRNRTRDYNIHFIKRGKHLILEMCSSTLSISSSRPSIRKVVTTTGSASRS